MRDYCTITQGGVYELQTNNQTNGLYLVISSNYYHTITQNAIVCMIKNKEQDFDPDCEFHVPFVYHTPGKDIDMVICTEQLFNVRSNRLLRYKFTLYDSILDKVYNAVKWIMFGRSMFSLEEVALKLNNVKEIEVKEEPKVEKIIDNGNLSIDEYQTLYARSFHDDLLVEPPKPELSKEEPKPGIIKPKPRKVKKEEPKVDSPKTKESKPIKSRRINKRDYKYIYDNYQEFILDRKTMEEPDFLIKWNLSKEEVRFRMTRCRQIVRERGEDLSWMQ